MSGSPAMLESPTGESADMSFHGSTMRHTRQRPRRHRAMGAERTRRRRCDRQTGRDWPRLAAYLSAGARPKYEEGTMFNLPKLVPLVVVMLSAGEAVTHAQAKPTEATKTTAANPTAAKTTTAKAVPAPAAKTKTKVAVKAAAAKPGKGATATGAGGAGNAAPAAAARDEKDVPPGTPPSGSSPLGVLKKSNDDLDKILKKKYPNWSPEAEAQKAEVRKLVGGFLDYRELAHRALAKHWETLTAAQRQEFVSTLRDLVERSYLKQVRGDPNYNIKYQKEEKTGSEATVDATLTTMTRGKKVNLALSYKLIFKERWLVYDVVTDEQSMLENYRAEFNKIINKEGFDTLLKRMKKKLEEKDE
ncbi:MAG: ABC transporter substrate-binding protein [Verrucomicrobiota bacterium]